MKNRFATSVNRVQRRNLIIESSESDDDSCEQKQPRVLFSAADIRSARAAAYPADPHTRSVRAADMFKRRRNADESSDDGQAAKPAAKKALTSLHVSRSAASAAATFEKGFPAAQDNEQVLDMGEIRRRFDAQQESLNELKGLISRLLREKSLSKSEATTTTPPTKKGAGCESPMVGIPNLTPRRSGSLRLRIPIPAPAAVEVPSSSVDATEFLEWLRGGDGPTSIRLPTDVVVSGNREFFQELMDETIALRDEHMDVLIHWIALKFDMERENRNWSVMDVCGWGGLLETEIATCARIMMPYVRGSYPGSVGKRWRDVECVYGFGFLESDSHWIGFQINMAQQSITVIDSMHMGAKRLSRFFQPMRYHLPQLCAMDGEWERRRGELVPLRQMWDLHFLSGNPRQAKNDKINCGLILMKTIELMVRGEPFSRFQSDLISQYRLQYCVDLFAHAPLVPPRP